MNKGGDARMYIHTYIHATYLHTFTDTYLPTYLPTYLDIAQLSGFGELLGLGDPVGFQPYIHTYIHTYIDQHLIPPLSKGIYIHR